MQSNVDIFGTYVWCYHVIIKVCALVSLSGWLWAQDHLNKRGFPFRERWAVQRVKGESEFYCCKLVKNLGQSILTIKQQVQIFDAYSIIKGCLLISSTVPTHVIHVLSHRCVCVSCCSGEADLQWSHDGQDHLREEWGAWALAQYRHVLYKCLCLCL